MRLNCAAVAAIVLLAHAASGHAQVLDPPRPSRAPRPDANRAEQRLTFEGNVLGGYDDNLNTLAGGDLFRPSQSGTVGFGEAGLRYFVGKPTRFLDVGCRGFANTYGGVAIAPSYGGDQSLRVLTNLRRKTQLKVDEAFSYSPFLSLGAFGSLSNTSVSQAPDANPTHGLAQSRTTMASLSASLKRDWNRNTSTEGGYSYVSRTYSAGGFADVQSSAASAGVHRALSRTIRLTSSYSRAERLISEVGGQRRVLDQTVDGGMTYQRALSRTRRVSVAAGSGTIYVNTVSAVTRTPVQYWTPSGFGNVRFDFSRSWNVSGDYKRAVHVLEGIDPQPYVTGVALVSVGGELTSWLDLGISAGYSAGESARVAEGLEGAYSSYLGTAQLRFRLSRSWSSIVNYDRYEYVLNGVASQSVGTGSHMQRNALRVGFSWALPLLPEPPAARRSEPRSKD